MFKKIKQEIKPKRIQRIEEGRRVVPKIEGRRQRALNIAAFVLGTVSFSISL
jgi:hypothetical protein